MRGFALAAALLLPAHAAIAQAPPPKERVEVRVDFGAQVKPKSFSDTFEVPLYTENERIATTYPDRGGGFFSIGGRYRIWKNLTVDVGVSRFARSGDAAIEASVPHPFFDQQFRTVTGSARVRREETATHVAACWLLPLTPAIRIGVSAGPVLMQVRQALVTAVTITESYPYDTAAFGSADVRNSSRGATGVYVGGDVTWMFSKHLGAGGVIQFARARVKEKAGDRTVPIEAGAAQAGGGVRLRF